MGTNKCALCSNAITRADSTKEHIIPNAIGGRKKLAGFICKSCNDKSGHTWDAELAKQLNPLSLLFGISRERGEPTPQPFECTDGQHYRLNSDGSMTIEKPEYKEVPTETGVQIQIKARTQKEAREMLESIKCKYPEADIESSLASLQVEKNYLDDMLLLMPLNFGGHGAGRSLVKSALALAVNADIDPEACEQALIYLRDENSKACFGYYYERDLVVNRPIDTVFHCVAVQGKPATKQLLGYVEFYGVFRMIICLSNNYTGREFSDCYAIDPVSGKEQNLNVDITLTLAEVIAAYDYKKIPRGSVEEAFHKVMPLAIEAGRKKEMDRVIKEAVTYASENCGVKSSEPFTPEHVTKIKELIMEKLIPFIIHNAGK